MIYSVVWTTDTSNFHNSLALTYVKILYTLLSDPLMYSVTWSTDYSIAWSTDIVCCLMQFPQLIGFSLCLVHIQQFSFQKEKSWRLWLTSWVVKVIPVWKVTASSSQWSVLTYNDVAIRCSTGINSQTPTILGLSQWFKFSNS